MAQQRKQFKLFQTPLDLAHNYWQQLLKPGDCVIDATSGNGHDTLFLAKLILSDEKGHIIALDIQQQAVENTRQLLKDNLKGLPGNISTYRQCHSTFPSFLEKESVALIVYNLGYLPGGNKSLTTLSDTTLKSLEAASSLIAPGGAISITCYPGHAAGKPEEELALHFAATLNPQEWSSCHHKWLNRKNAPSLILIQRALKEPG